jgi:CubicO group peptidase (beta-lactamase class C family)
MLGLVLRLTSPDIRLRPVRLHENSLTEHGDSICLLLGLQKLGGAAVRLLCRLRLTAGLRFILTDRPHRQNHQNGKYRNAIRDLCHQIEYISRHRVENDKTNLILSYFQQRSTFARARYINGWEANMLRSFAIVALLTLACSAQDTARMELVIQSYAANKTFMGSVLVARGSEIVLSKGYGSADLEWDVPNSPSTKFRLGSITKQFTAASVLLLEERGKLKVEDAVKKYLPEAPAAWDKITIYNLLTHTSGIPNFTSFPEYPKLEPFPITTEKLVAVFRDKPLDFQPGEKYSYSNSGFVLLGYLIEKISRQSYEKFLQENIFTPLGMKDSGYDSNSALIPRRASGYTHGPNGFRNAGYVNMTIPFSAGALYSTTEDLLRWEQGLFGAKLLSPVSLQKMTTPFKDDYAFGLLVQTRSGRKVIWHNGGIEGFNTHLEYFPDTKIAVAVLGNVNGTAPDEIGQKLGALANGDKITLPSERKEITVAPSILSGYVGVYQFTPRASMTITLNGGQLISQMSGQGKVPLFPESATMFFAKVVDAEVEFGKDDKGSYLILHQGGRDQKVPRASDMVSERKEVAVAPALLSQYAGQYQLRPGFNLTITAEDSRLWAQATGQGRFELSAESETKFFSKDIDIQIEFAKDDKGAVTLTLHQGPIEMRGERQ